MKLPAIVGGWDRPCRALYGRKTLVRLKGISLDRASLPYVREEPSQTASPMQTERRNVHKAFPFDR